MMLLMQGIELVLVQYVLEAWVVLILFCHSILPGINYLTSLFLSAIDMLNQFSKIYVMHRGQ